ncbi:MAG: hypothetical protein PHD81_00970 [Candidatus Nanoarchaeia archaeon]|nr:hypothetical protein [Candidatus Nanoarchaeia archaeon]MDD5587662.1 hypothetical protein [Candidatus Nanoarchaeia archaeon]
MSKRGQITVFMILGFVILIVILLLYFLQDNLKETIYGTRPVLDKKLTSIKEEMQKCVSDLSNSAINQMGNQGGTLTPTNYILFKGEKISYLCFDFPLTDIDPSTGKHRVGCENQMLVRNKMEKELKDYMKGQFNTCFNANNFRSTYYKLTVGEFDINVTIEDDVVKYGVTYPVVLERENVKVNFDGLDFTQETSLGEIQNAVNDILEFESLFGEFDNVGYTLLQKSRVEVFRTDLYPDTIYSITTPGRQYTLQFAIKGVDTHVV